MGNNELRGERAPGASVRDKGTLGHPFGRHGREFHDPYGPRGALQPRNRSYPIMACTFIQRSDRDVTLPRCTRKRVGEVALRVARLGLKLRVGNPKGRQPRQLRENGVGTLAPGTARYEVGLVGLLRSRSRRPWTNPNVPSPR
ncbi:hypothetical protein CDL15_Pgr002263 [Punica granatum]|uniref:Uncharacterized protein n=1 Tax=Punica granatum TaxID=22663 RepID=A0A218WDP5_PUNGR|nr:hypothetical protein CDL15_Pgr002263 [Punica granatum]